MNKAHRFEGRPRRWWSLASGLIIVVLVAVMVGVALHTSKHPQSASLAVGAPAPDGSFTTTKGDTSSIKALHGQATLVWFVSTSCGSCEAGTQAMAKQIDQFSQHHVKVVELELFDNLGAGSSDIRTFGHSLAGNKFGHPDWVWGNASQALTSTFNPKSYLDIYYLIDANGKIAYYNSAPEATMSTLLTKVKALNAS